MPEFSFVAKTSNGEAVHSTRFSESEASLVSLLRKEGLVVISVNHVIAAKHKKPARRGKIKTKDLGVFCRQFSTMLEAGLPVLEALEGIAEQIQNPALASVLKEVGKDIEAGSTLSQALGEHGTAFSLLFVSMVKAGEEAGALPSVLGRLATYLESRAALARKIKAASTYPLFIACFFAIAVSAVMFFLIPKFEEIFSGFDIELPALTQTLIAISRFVGHNIAWELLILVGGSYFLFKWKKTPKGKEKIDTWLLKAPVFGKLVQKAAIARFSQTLSTLLNNGVSVVAALDIVGETSGNAVVKSAIDRVGEGVVNGSTITDKLAECPIFPRMVVSMVSAGESSGRLPSMLEKVAAFYSDEVDTAISGLTAMIEPAMIVGLGVIVTITVLAIYLPIFQMATSIQ